MRILIVGDHVLFREGLCHVLDKLEGQTSALEVPDSGSALRQILSSNIYVLPVKASQKNKVLTIG